jgi:hypothetical protein
MSQWEFAAAVSGYVKANAPEDGPTAPKLSDLAQALRNSKS